MNEKDSEFLKYLYLIRDGKKIDDIEEYNPFNKNPRGTHIYLCACHTILKSTDNNKEKQFNAARAYEMMC